MKSKTEIKIIIFMTLGILIALSPLMNSDFNFGDINFNSTDDAKVSLDNKNLKNSKVSGKIQIIGNSGWITAKAAGICTGLGTSNNPYIIEDFVINGGNLGNCIEIMNTDVYFEIKNCTLYNSGTNFDNAGILLNNVDNGKLLNNSCSYNSMGISLEYCDYNTISNNTANYNSNYGISIGFSNSNEILGNILNHNMENGIDLWSSSNNNILGNTANYNVLYGIFLGISDNNDVSENNINHNYEGLLIEECDYNTIVENTISNHFVGIHIIQSKCNEILNNDFSDNSIDISGTQDYCGIPPLINPFPIENILILGIIIGIIIVSTIFLAVMIKRKGRPPRQKVILTEKFKEKLKIKEIPVREINLVPEFKSKLIVSPDLKKLDVIQEVIIPSSSEKKPEELFEKEEKIVKDTIEVPKIEIISCQFCGMELSSDVIFCLRCGHKLKK